MLVSVLVLWFAGNSQSCKFTITPSQLFSSLNSLIIGTTCGDCDTALKKCYPSVQLRVYGSWEAAQTIVDWDTSVGGGCSVLGEIDMSPFTPVTHDVSISLLPQACSPQYQQQHFTISSFLFLDMTTGTETPLSSEPYVAELFTPLQPTTRVDLASLPESSKYIFWSSTGSVLVELPDPEPSDLTCLPEVSDNTRYLYQLSPTELVLLYNGVLTLITSGGAASLLDVEECVWQVSLTSDLTKRRIYVITQDSVSDSVTRNSIYRLSAELEVSKFLGSEELVMSDSESFICLGSSGTSTEYSSLRVLDILSIESVSEQITILEQVSDSITTYYYLIQNNGNSGTCHKFPSTASSVSEITALNDVPTGSTTFKINKLHSLQPSSPHVLGVGSVVLYSPCLGCSWYLLPIEHSPGAEYRIATDNAGRYVIQTSNSLYYGFFGNCIELSQNYFMDDFSPADLLKIKDLEVILTSFHDSSGTVGQTDTVVDLVSVDQFIRETAKQEDILSGMVHKNILVGVCSNHSSSFTRQSTLTYHQSYRHQEECLKDMLPERVYLQFEESYTIDLEFSLFNPELSDMDYLVKESFVTMNVWNGTLLDVDIQKVVDYRLMRVVYTVTLSDIGTATRAPPGEAVTPVSVAVLASQPTLLSPFHVILGCKPGQRVSLNLEDTPDLLSSTTSNVTHLQFEFHFHPHFSVEDLVSGTSLPYDGNYTLTVMGAGQTLGDIRMFDDKELEKYNTNGGSTSVWTWNDSYNRIKWLCRERSPCSNTFPRLLEGVPNYCFKIKFSNAEFTDSDSYCIFEEELILCVHGLPLSVWHSLVSLSTFIVTALVAVVAIFIKKYSCRTLLEELKLRKREEDDVEEEHALFLKDQMISNRQRNSRNSSVAANGRRTSIVHHIRVIQGTDRYNSLAPNSATTQRKSVVPRPHH